MNATGTLRRVLLRPPRNPPNNRSRITKATSTAPNTGQLLRQAAPRDHTEKPKMTRIGKLSDTEKSAVVPRKAS